VDIRHKFEKSFTFSYLLLLGWLNLALLEMVLSGEIKEADEDFGGNPHPPLSYTN
jgi:hypothetical protein